MLFAWEEIKPGEGQVGNVGGSRLNRGGREDPREGGRGELATPPTRARAMRMGRFEQSRNGPDCSCLLMALLQYLGAQS